MSKVRTKKLRKLGLNTKNQIRSARKYIIAYPKCNRGYAYNNYAFHLGVLDIFSTYQTPICEI